MKLELEPSSPFDLGLTLCCGQAFRWDKMGEWWYGVVGDRIVKIRQEGKELEFEGVDKSFVASYFRLADDLNRILSVIGKDKYICMTIDKNKGLRILRQEPWECLISYICATYKNIASIRRMLLALSKKFGQMTRFQESNFYTFPAPGKLARASVKELAECELGYRAKYVSQTARMVYDGEFDLENLKRLPYKKAKEALLELPGVGQKVADCVLLFSLDKLEAFPVDVWVKRAVLRHYARHFPRNFVVKMQKEESLSTSEYERLNRFGREYFGDFAGYAQEYLYHYERTCSRQ
jgi:N-glycosylase/DNA lyase